MTERIAIDFSNHVAHIKLNRPEKMNALDSHMFDAINSIQQKLDALDDLRAVVLSGEGRSFCAGLDVENFSQILNPKQSQSMRALEARTHKLWNDFQYATWVWRELDVPVITALHGSTFGGGLQIALGADIRYATPDTRLSIVLRELTYTGRIIEAEEAKTLGLVTQITEDPVALALSTAKTIAEKNPDAIKANKRIYNNLHYKNIADGMLEESLEQQAIIGSSNQLEAVMAALEKRSANFKNN